MRDVDGLLLDIDGVLAISWEPLPGATETVSWLRDEGIPFRLVTNTTTLTRDDLTGTLRGAGFDVSPEEIITAVVSTAGYLRAHHPRARCFLLSDGNALGDLEGVELVEPGEPADVVVVGGASEDFTYANVNNAFRLLMEGAALVGMHRNLYWRTDEGLQLDGGAYIAGLEEAVGVEATICGKPTREYFESALGMLGLPAERVAMVGDDIENDVLGAQAAGMIGVLVRTGKFLPRDLERAPTPPDHVIESFPSLPELLRPT
jgi:HAD superfamily hydrolase (TIGR01458 family)